jgi:hypothetical protein
LKGRNQFQNINLDSAAIVGVEKARSHNEGGREYLEPCRDSSESSTIRLRQTSEKSIVQGYHAENSHLSSPKGPFSPVPEVSSKIPEISNEHKRLSHSVSPTNSEIFSLYSDLKIDLESGNSNQQAARVELTHHLDQNLPVAEYESRSSIPQPASRTPLIVQNDTPLISGHTAVMVSCVPEVENQSKSSIPLPFAHATGTSFQPSSELSNSSPTSFSSSSLIPTPEPNSLQGTPKLELSERNHTQEASSLSNLQVAASAPDSGQAKPADM